MRRADRRGLTLLEVMLALAILGIAGAAWLELAGQSARAVRSARTREDEVDSASALLAHLASMPAESLLARVGRRREGSFVVTIFEDRPRLFQALIADAGGVLLETSFAFTDTTDATR